VPDTPAPSSSPVIPPTSSTSSTSSTLAAPVDPTWAQQPMSLQTTLIMAFTTAVLSAVGTGGGLTAFTGSTQQEIVEIRRSVEELTETVDSIYAIVDAAHPRDIRPRRDPED